MPNTPRDYSASSLDSMQESLEIVKKGDSNLIRETDSFDSTYYIDKVDQTNRQVHNNLLLSQIGD